MTDYEKNVMRNIIYAIETGGQVYGNKDYASFTEAYTNNNNEIAITIGAAQWYGTEAKNLLNTIRQANPTLFSSLDSADIASDLDSADWSTYQVAKGSAKAQCIVTIINTETGRQCQDSLVDEQMEQYVREAANLGVTDMDAKMMCANFRHQGGTGAVTRILAKTGTPYTLDRLYAACQSDMGNQVGTYELRQNMVYDSLKKYISNYTLTPETAIRTVIKIAQDEVGYLEKRSDAELDSKTGNADDGNYTKYWRDIKPEWQGQPWCACFVTWIFQKAFGKEKTESILKHYPYTYVPTLASLFTNNSNPEVGDIVMFWNGNEFSHTGLVIDVRGDLFVTIEGNTAPNTGIVDNGDGVYQKQYYNSNMTGTKFARPDYSLVTEIKSDGSWEAPYPDVSWNLTGTATCGGDGVNVRATPGGTIIGSLSKGNRFEVDGTKSGEWVHIKATGIGIGYMHQNYVSYDNENLSNVSTAQVELNRRFNSELVVDGIWGTASKKAFISAIQSSLNTVYDTRLSVDGIWGPATESACAAHVLREGANNLYVGVLQIGLYSTGMALSGGIDCSFGSSTEQGVITFQIRKGLTADGIVGANTMRELAE